MGELLGISTFCGQANLPGLATLKYLPIDWIDAGEYEEYISSTHNFQKAIVPSLGGEQWLTMPFFATRGDGWQQGSRQTEQGIEYPQDVSGLLRNLRPEVEGELETMERHRFLVHLTLRNGKNLLVGRLHEPLDFRAESDSGSRNAGLNGYSFRFSGATSRRAYGYVPVF